MTAQAFLDARDFLLRHRTDYDTRLPRFPLAAARVVQLGARLLRRDGARQRAPRAVDRRCRDGRGRAGFVRADVGALVADGQSSAPARGGPRRPPAADAAEPRRAVGRHAGRDEARRGGAARHHAAARRGGARSRDDRRRALRGDRRGRGREIRPGRRGGDAHHRRRRARGLAALRRGLRRLGRIRARRAHPRRRPAAALFHLGHHLQAEARRAHASHLSGRPPVDDVLDRPAAGRHPLEHQLAGLGQARVELLLRAVERAGLRVRLQLRALRSQAGARRAGALRHDHAVRAADRLAHAGAAAAGLLCGQAARDRRRGRAAQSRDHRARAPRLGHHHPRRLRPDRNHLPDRQFAGPAGGGRLDGPPAAGLPRGAARSRRRAGGGGRDRAAAGRRASRSA